MSGEASLPRLSALAELHDRLADIERSGRGLADDAALSVLQDRLLPPLGGEERTGGYSAPVFAGTRTLSYLRRPRQVAGMMRRVRSEAKLRGRRAASGRPSSSEGRRSVDLPPPPAVATMALPVIRSITPRTRHRLAAVRLRRDEVEEAEQLAARRAVEPIDKDALYWELAEAGATLAALEEGGEDSTPDAPAGPASEAAGAGNSERAIITRAFTRRGAIMPGDAVALRATALYQPKEEEAAAGDAAEARARPRRQRRAALLGDALQQVQREEAARASMKAAAAAAADVGDAAKEAMLHSDGFQLLLRLRQPLPAHGSGDGGKRSRAHMHFGSHSVVSLHPRSERARVRRMRRRRLKDVQRRRAREAAAAAAGGGSVDAAASVAGPAAAGASSGATAAASLTTSLAADCEVAHDLAGDISFTERVRMEKWQFDIPVGLLLSESASRFKAERQQRAARQLLALLRHVRLTRQLLRWRRATRAMLLAELEAAAALLQRVWRGACGRKAAAHRRRALEIVRERQLAAEARRRARRLAATCFLQRVWRGYRGRLIVWHMRRFDRAATAIAAAWRGYRARCLLAPVFEDARHVAACATTIQAAWRGARGRRHAALLRRIAAVSRDRFQREARAYMSRRQLIQHGAAVTLQEWWRAHFRLRQTRARIQVRKRILAIRLQRVWRGHRARKVYRAMRAERDALLRTQNAAATSVQAIARGWLARRLRARKQAAARLARAERLRRKQLIDTYGFASVRMDDSGELILVDRVKSRLLRARAHLVGFWRRYAPFRVRRNVAAARTIQRVWRGYRVRCQLGRWVKLRAEAERRAHVRARKAAAALLQRVWRDHAVWSVYWRAKRDRAARLLQRLCRGALARAFVRRLRRKHAAATTIRKFWVGFVTRRWLRHTLDSTEQRHWGAMRIQRVARAWLARRVLHRLQEAKRFSAEEYTFGGVQLRRTIARWKFTLLHRSLSQPFEAGGTLQSLFASVCSVGLKDKSVRMDNMRYSKMMRDTPGILTAEVTPNMVDLIFMRVKARAERTIGFDQFVQALHAVADATHGDVSSYHGFSGQQARTLKLLYTVILSAKWARPHRQALDEQVLSHLSRACTSIQRMVRGTKTRALFRTMRHARSLWEEAERQRLAATRVQKMWRFFHARRRIARLAARIYQKYETEDGQPYYFNPRTGVTSWVKPRFLGDADIDDIIRLPPKQLEFVLYCTFCGDAPASRSCSDCADFYCDSCFDAFHRGSERKSAHDWEAIHLCDRCNYQTATQDCRDCSDQKHYCDSCYADRHALPRYRGHRRQPRLVLCSECEERSVRWNCTDCHDLYCTQCFSTVHSKGAKASHSAVFLRWFTPADKAQLDAAAARRREAARAAAARQRKQAEEAEARRLLSKQRRAVRVLEAAWLQYRYRSRLLRLKERAKWLRRKRDDRIRRSPLYRVKLLFGKAPALESDADWEVEEKKLPFWVTPERLRRFSELGRPRRHVRMRTALADGVFKQLLSRLRREAKPEDIADNWSRRINWDTGEFEWVNSVTGRIMTTKPVALEVADARAAEEAGDDAAGASSSMMLREDSLAGRTQFLSADALKLNRVVATRGVRRAPGGRRR